MVGCTRAAMPRASRLATASSLMRKPIRLAYSMSAGTMWRMPSIGNASGARMHAEREPGQDRELVRRVDAVDVGARVGLGEAEILRALQARLVRLAGRLHLGQDVVAGAVHDPVQRLHAVRAQPLAQRAQHRDRPAHAGLEGDLAALRRGEREDLAAVLGEQRLVRGDDVLARVERGQHQIARDARAADELDHQVDRRDRRRSRASRATAGSRRATRRGRARGRCRRCARARAESRAARRCSAPWLWNARTTPVPIVPSPTSPTRMARSAIAQEPLHAAHRLADAVRVLDQREAHEALPRRTEADARRDRDLPPSRAGASRTRASRAT